MSIISFSKLPLMAATFLIIGIMKATSTSAIAEVGPDNLLVSGWEFISGGEKKISAADGKAGDKFGTSVSICGSYAYAGAPFDKMNDVYAGSVYEHLLDSAGGWVRTGKLSPGASGETGDSYGFSVSCDGNVIAIGAPNDSSHYAEGGATYVYIRRSDGTKLSAKITSYYGEENEYFGHSVAVSANLLLVGAVGSSQAGVSSGIVYSYRKELELSDDLLDDDDKYDDDLVPHGWNIEAVFYPADVAAYDKFGFHIAVSGGLIVVGSPNADARRGAVYVFNRTLVYDESEDDLYDDDGKKVPTYLHLARLTGGEGTVKREFFGISVAVHVHTIVVGQYRGYDDTYDVPRGAAHVFTTHSSGRQLSSWEHMAILMEPVNTPVQNFFGRSVAVLDNSILVDAPGSSAFSNATLYAFGRYHVKASFASGAHLRTRESVYRSASSSDEYVIWSHQATLIAGGRAAQSGADELVLGQAVAIGDSGIGIVGSAATIGSRGDAAGAMFAFQAIAVDGGSSDTDDDPLIGGTIESSSRGKNVNKNLAWLIILVIPACVLAVCLYKQQRKRKRRRAGPSSSGRSFGEGTGVGTGGQYECADDNSTDISAIDSEMNFRDIRGRVNNKLSMLSRHAKDWVDRAIQNPVYFNQAESDYSDDNSDVGMDDSTGSSFSSSIWNFGGRKSSNNLVQGTTANSSGRPLSKRTTHQVLATARAVANDMNHPNQDEVAVLLRTHEKDWITEEKFMDTLEELVY